MDRLARQSGAPAVSAASSDPKGDANGWYRDDRGRRLNVKERSPDGSKTLSQMAREHDEWRESQPQTSRCAQPGCGWVFVGTVGTARDAFAAHLKDAHPQVKSLTARQRRNREIADAKKRRADADRARVEQRELRQDRPAEADADITTSVGGQDVEGADGAFPADSRVGGANTRRPLIRWTREEAVDAVRVAAGMLGHPPSHHDYMVRRDIPMPSGPTAIKLFGSWADMIEAAGFDRPTRATRYTRQDSFGLSRSAGFSGPVVSPPDEQQPDGKPAATADGSGAAGAQTPAADPDIAVRLARVLNDVGVEVAAAVERFAAMHSPHEGYAVLREELDELWEHVKANSGRGRDARVEACQVAAMAVRYILDLSDEVSA